MQAGLRRSLRPRPAVRHRAGPGVQRLPRSVTAPGRHRRRGRGAAHLGWRRRRLAAGHRQHRTAPAVRARAGRIRRRAGRVWCSPRDTPPISAPSSACPARVRCWCPTPTATPRWWTPAGCRGPGWSSPRTATSTPSTRRWPAATRSARWSSPTRCSAPTARWLRCGELHEVCRRHGALLIVDEAHGLGVRGDGGRGLLHEVGLAGAPDVVMTTTLSKALGSQGGAVLGPAAVRDHLIDAARTFIFDTGLAPGGARRRARPRCGVLSAEPSRAAGGAARMPRALAQICEVAERPESAVVSVILGDPEVAVAAATACLDAGVRVGCFRPPTVPAGTSRLRLTARASLTADDLDLARTGADATCSRRAAPRDRPGRHRHRHRGRQDGRHRGPGRAPAKHGPRCRGVQAGADRHRRRRRRPGRGRPAVRGDRTCSGLARYPQPLAPVAAAERAGMSLPTRARPAGADPRRRPPRAADAGRGCRRPAGRTGRRRA